MVRHLSTSGNIVQEQHGRRLYRLIMPRFSETSLLDRLIVPAGKKIKLARLCDRLEGRLCLRQARSERASSRRWTILPIEQGVQGFDPADFIERLRAKEP